MCRSLADSGRRCPCSYAPRRSAADRAYYAAKKAAKATTAPAAPSPDASPSATTGDDTALIIERARSGFLTPADTREAEERCGLTAAREARARAGADLREDPDNPALQEALRAARAQLDQANTAYSDWLASLPSPAEAEQLVVQTGHAVAARAEQIAGITAEQARISYQERLGEANERYANLTDQAAAARTEFVETLERLRAEFKPLQAHRDALEKDPSATPEQRNAAQAAVDAKLATFDKVDRTRVVDLEHAKATAYEELARLRAGTDKQTGEDLRRLAEGYTAALGEIREVGGQMSWADKSQAKAITIFDQAAQVYPAEWIAKSNQGTAPLARWSKARAHYSGARTVETKTLERVSSVLFMARDDYESRTSELPRSIYGLCKTLRPATAEEAAEARFAPDDGQDVYVAEHWDVLGNGRGGPAVHPPSGRGWERAQYVDADGEVQTTWRRPKKKYRTLSATVMPEITVNDSVTALSGTERTGYDVAVHELSHRMESRIPMIGMMEAQFLLRRTSNPDGTRQPLKRLYKGKKEVAREDNFVNPYMGKEYEGATYHEVLSCGTQGLFGGEFGGFIGAKAGTPADDDYRAFILGVMATAR